MKKKPLDLSVIPTFSDDILKYNYTRFRESVALWEATGACYTASADKVFKGVCDREFATFDALSKEMKKRNLK